MPPLDTHRPSLYPSQWNRLIHAVTVEGKTVRVPTASPRHAMRLRLRFYTFRRSLHQADKQLALTADGVMVLIEGEVAVFCPRDMNAEAKMLDEALEAVG